MELVSVVGEGLVGGHEGEILLVESLLDAFTQKNVLRMLSISAFLYPRESFSLAYALRASNKVTESWRMRCVGQSDRVLGVWKRSAQLR